MEDPRQHCRHIIVQVSRSRMLDITEHGAPQGLPERGKSGTGEPGGVGVADWRATMENNTGIVCSIGILFHHVAKV